jgi:hypothetical protein
MVHQENVPKEMFIRKRCAALKVCSYWYFSNNDKHHKVGLKILNWNLHPQFAKRAHIPDYIPMLHQATVYSKKD